MVVKIDYRDGKYPQPVHDVLAGSDWCIKHLLPQNGTDILGKGTGRVEGSIRNGIGVYGELVGGSLAMMLGMTECDPGLATSCTRTSGGGIRPNKETNELRGGKPYIKAVAVKDAVVDWIMPCTPSPATQQADNLTVAESQTYTHDHLKNLRTRLFRTKTHPSTYFDPFASPIHFLRTPAADVPEAVWPMIEETRMKKVEEASEAVEGLWDVLAELEEEAAEVLRPTLGGSMPQDRADEVDGEKSRRGYSSRQDQSETSMRPRNNKVETANKSSTSSAPSSSSDLVIQDQPPSQSARAETTRRRIPLRWPPAVLPSTTRMPFCNITASRPPLSTASIPLAQQTSRLKKHNAEAPQPPLVAQAQELARLLRRAWIKYCFARESHSPLSLPAKAGSRRGRYLDPDDEDDEEANVGGDTPDAVALSRSGDKLLERLVLKGLMDDDEGVDGYNSSEKEAAEEEEPLKKQARVLRRMARERVEWGIVFAGKSREDGGKGDINDDNDEINRVGRWLGDALRR
jgi:hypothetical protein